MKIAVTVSTRSLEKTTIGWSIQDWVPDQMQLRVLRSESRFGPYDPITGWFQATASSSLEDTTHLHKITRRWYYQIETDKAVDGEHLVYPYPYGASTERRSDSEARLKASENELLYRKHGQAVIYFPCRSYGSRCPKCFDSVTGKQLMANCDACYSTTYSGGFMYPVKCWIMLEDKTTSNNRDTGAGVPIISRQASGRFPWFLDVKVGDVVVDEDNNRWKVGEPIQVVSKRGCVLYQTAKLFLITLDCIEYSLPIPATIDVPTRSWKYVPEFLR
jgi:hypothetical protein